jgi:hypothetical protein
VTDEAIVIEEAPPEPQPIGLPKALARMSEEQRREWIIDALRGKQDEQLAA